MSAETLPTVPTVPTDHDDPINTRILEVSEDLVEGFQRYPLQHIAEKSGVPLETVLERIRAMVEAGVIRRVRQTLLATNLAEGALVAWKVPAEKLDFMASMFRYVPLRAGQRLFEEGELGLSMYIVLRYRTERTKMAFRWAAVSPFFRFS